MKTTLLVGAIVTILVAAVIIPSTLASPGPGMGPGYGQGPGQGRGPGQGMGPGQGQGQSGRGPVIGIPDDVHQAIETAVRAAAARVLKITPEELDRARASGKTMAEMNDRTGAGLGEYSGQMLVIEMLVGAISGALSGVPMESVVANLQGYFESVGHGGKMPAWLTGDYLMRVQERLRKLVGHWNGTPFGETMEVVWQE